ncbi:hypothetical protein [Anabaena sp. PCC 7938]|uniref:hypothetical protein n=1 Tax=Anabaena sp. PCC 7938 TaxID=1296340 RepID=UPI002030D5C8|nr:hypothetical protein [Anabaena sp. CCAP 1446/1C]
MRKHQPWRDGSLQTNDLPDVPSNKGVVRDSKPGRGGSLPATEAIETNYQRSTSEPQK